MRPVGISRDFLDAAGRNVWGDIGLDGFDEAGIAWEYLPDDVPVLRPEDIDGRPAVLFAAPAVDATTFSGVTEPPMVLARFGVGYDAVDLDACTDAGVAVTITPDGARRPVATAALGMLLGGLLNLGIKDRLVREKRWDERTSWMGRGLTGTTVGVVGFGGTGTDLARLLAPFEVELLAYDPYCPLSRAEEFGAELVGLEDLAARSDAIVVMAVLTPETHHLIDADFLDRVKPTATLVNVARGPIIDEPALIAALRDGRLRAAALDVFENEPLPDDSPLRSLDNVLLSPHCVGWTDEMSLGNGRSAVRAVVGALAGEIPSFVVNRPVLETARWRDLSAVTA
ncbi:MULTISPECIES: NAD(P)-dependent oxidoreductase [Microbacterium]|jgi:phosphoglycerate dehydrogenase-like enzyme|uniref:NAD(P)-dependent oxidoreductase n=1 Tax=Microbacterium TaxID=33882 RepID=UPI0023DB25E8|nr:MULTISPECIES: NAD(P)-dependent oxidoreductase [Microbacterium]MDF2045108.1 NAD(P)-dependent oxidoreductase [Microbacterium sp. Kw_RZR3]MDF2918763.1 dehydrogenase [Microbacterium sp.]MDQ1074758.1 phosphoglycerate dehydrogenase-like enzyme [Microbacterium sp. SORGH_AS_0969]MDQ1114984.1 phosphoglycerate dehydrogenase-like enzyme [Microbacterium testaceum]